MKKYDKLIFVSGSDTATSPMAEAIMQSKYLLEDILIDSKGLVVLFPEPINPKAEDILEENGLSMQEHVSEQFVKADFDERTLVLTMDHAQKEKMMADYEDVKNLYMLTEYIKADGEVTDPYGGTLDDYGSCFLQLETWITRLVVILNEEELMA